jgi:N-acetylmuramoyl-L-alanine amidase
LPMKPIVCQKVKSSLLILFLSVSALVVSGCATLFQRGDPAGYGGALNYEGVDFSVLREKTMVLDPGHGGRYSGAVGKGGLAEKDVNLAVAIILRDLLVSYGARVVMTRDEDTDLLPESTDGPVRDDLQSRVDSAYAADDAVFFLSIHHNSLGATDKRHNATETYYKMGDTGPSLDLARYLHRHLNRAVGLPKQAIRPGNYYVLRNNRHPAVLGEASYLSHPGTEKKLAGQSARLLEAYSYLLGIVDYLAGGIPVVDSLQLPGPDPLQSPYPLVVTRVYDETGAKGIDPQQLEVTIDEEPVPFSYDPLGGSLVALADHPLANGAHRAAVRAKNLAGNAAREAVADFSIAVPPANLRLTSSLEVLPLDGNTPARISAVVSDTRGVPVADGTEVLFEFSDPNLPTRTIPTSNGTASLTLVAIANRPLELRASVGDISEKMTVPVGDIPGQNALVLKTMDHLNMPLGKVKVTIAGAGIFATDNDGILTVNGLAPGKYKILPETGGYLPEEREVSLGSQGTEIAVFRMQPVLGGVLLGRRVALDPQAGGENPGALGREGTRESDVNLAVARYLADYLERGGALVTLTRNESTNPGPWQKTALVEESGAEILVSISHSGKMSKNLPPMTTVRHYPGSTQGELLALALADCLRGFAATPYQGAGSYHGVDPASQRIIQQVGCPAVWVRAASVADIRAETKLADPVYLRKEAHAIFSGICRYFGWEPEGAAHHFAGRLSDGAGGLVSSALVLLDGWRPAQSDETGRFLFQYVEPGPHRLEILHRGRAYGPYQAESNHVLELLLKNE